MQVAHDRPPVVPRRTQSVRVLNGYLSKGLRTASETDSSAGVYRPNRPLTRSKTSRRSLDAMEQQADDLFDFLSDLENKKASGNTDEIMSFLTESLNVGLDMKDKSSDNSSEKTSGIPLRSKRLSVRDKAKMFLKPDIEEDPHEPAEEKKRYRKSLGTRRIASFSENMNNNHSVVSSSSRCSVCTIPEECDSSCHDKNSSSRKSSTSSSFSSRNSSVSSPVFENPKTSLASSDMQPPTPTSFGAGKSSSKRKILFATTVHFTDPTCDHQDKDSTVGPACLGR